MNIRRRTARVLAAAIWSGAVILAFQAAAQETETFEEQFENEFRERSQGGDWIALEQGEAVPREAYRTLDADPYEEDYGRRLAEGYSYAETDDGTRLLIEIANGIVAEILRQPPESAPAVAAEQPRSGRLDIPPGHYPPSGSCRVWFPDRPPGHQPPPGNCDVYVPRGAVLVRE